MNFINWRIAYFSNAGIMFILVIIFYSISIESLRVSISKENFNELVDSIRYLTKINGVDKEEVELYIDELSKKKTNSKTPNNIDNKLDSNRKDSINTNNEENQKSYNEDEIKNEIEINLLPSAANESIKDKENLCIFFMKFLIGFSLFMFLILTVTFEIKNYGTNISIVLYTIFSIASFPFYILVSYLMNIKMIGRRYAIIMLFLLLLVFQISNFFIDESYKKYSYMAYRIVLLASQIPMHTLINESFPTKSRNSKYGNLYVAAKILSLASPFALEFFNYTEFTIVISTVIVVISVMILLIKETHLVSIE